MMLSPPEVTDFRYRAARPDGTTELGELQAPSRDNAVAALNARGLFPLEVTARPPMRARRGHLSASDLALGLRVLANLLDAGLPISRSLAAFEELAPPGWHTGLERIRNQVREGQTLAAALAHSSLDIPPLVIGIIQAGEAGSGLAAAVRSAAELTEHAAATRAAIRAALTYPGILACVGTASIVLLVGLVLPRFALILADLGQSLPPATRFVLASAAVARATALPTVLALAALMILWRRWTTTPAGRQRWHAQLLAVPGVGAVRHSAATSRACAAAAALLRSGVPLAGSLQHAAAASGDAAIASRVLAARAHVTMGSPIARALHEAQAFTSTATRLIRAGEETGRLAELLEHAARIERERAQELTRGAVRLMEPALILAFGALVALVSAALLQAVYSVRPGT